MKQGRGVGGASRRLAYWLAWAVCALLDANSPQLPTYSIECELECSCLRLLARVDLHRGRLLGDRRYHRLAPPLPADRLDLLRYRPYRGGGPLRRRVRPLRPTGASPLTSGR